MSVTNLKTVTSRSPERDALSDAIERHREITEQFAGIRKARRETEGRLYGPGSAANRVEIAAKAVEVAKTAAAEHAINVALGKGAVPPISAKAARLALEEATDELETVKATSAALEAREREADGELHRAKRDIDEAVRAVIKASPAVRAVFREYAVAKRKVANLLAMRRFITERLNAAPDDLEDAEDEPGDVGARIANWEAAVAALRIDADAPLPEK